MEKHKEQLASSAHEFDEIVAPLERRARQRLTRSGRLDCERAFNENPDGFRACVDRALAKGNGSPVGLLVRMCRDGDHDLPKAPPAPAAVNSTTGCTHESCRGLEVCGYA